MKFRLGGWVLGAAAILLLWNGSVAVPVAINQTRGSGESYVLAYRTWLVHPRDVTINLVRVTDEASPADLWETLSLAAQGLNGRRYYEVHLTRLMSDRLRLNGETFSAVGEATSNDESFPLIIMGIGNDVTFPNGQIVRSHGGSGPAPFIAEMATQVRAANRAAVYWISGRDPGE